MSWEGTEVPIGYLIATTSRALKHYFFVFRRQMDLDEFSFPAGQLMMLLEQEPAPMCQRDIEKALHMSKSSVTGLVKALEREGYLSRNPVPGDARLKRLVLTEKGHRANRLCEQSFQEGERNVADVLTEQERRELQRICGKLQNFVQDRLKEGSYAENADGADKRI